MASHNTPNQGERSNNRSRPNTNANLKSNAAVNIVDLQPRNNNTTFIGKIVEVVAVPKESHNSDKPRIFLKGVVGDSTGTVRFDLAQKDDVQFKKGDIVQFDRAMNKVDKDHHHYVEVKDLGSYQILNDHEDINVNLSVNKSEEVIPEGERPPRVNTHQRKNNSSYNNNNSNNNRNTNQNNRVKNNNYSNNYNNNHSNNNHSNNHSNNNNNASQQNNNKPYNRQDNNNSRNFKNNSQSFQKFPVFQKPIPIDQLTPGSKGQIILGKVISVETYSSNNKEIEQTYLKGQIGDETGCINFDFKSQKNRPISKNDIVQLSNVMNKVNEQGHHYVTVGRFGFYTIFSEIHVNTENDKSGFQYEIKND